jgi:hypothetical protein
MPVLAGALIPQYDDVSASSSKPYVIAVDKLDFAASLRAIQSSARTSGLDDKKLAGLSQSPVFRVLVARASRLAMLLSYASAILAVEDIELQVTKGNATIASYMEREILKTVSLP